MKYDLMKIDDYLFIIGDLYKSDKFPYLVAEKFGTDNNFSIWQVDNPNDLDDKNQYRILAHRPLNGARYLDNIDVLPLLNQEDDIEDLFNNSWIGKKVNYNTDIGTSFKEAYNKAREKYNLTLNKLIDMYIEKTGYGMDMWSKEENETMSTIADIIESLQQPKLPIAFECEIEPKFKHIGSSKEVKGSGSRIKNKYAGNPKTFINFDGRSEWVGKYIYE
jgi:hypothetical protein